MINPDMIGLSFDVNENPTVLDRIVSYHTDAVGQEVEVRNMTREVQERADNSEVFYPNWTPEQRWENALNYYGYTSTNLDRPDLDQYWTRDVSRHATTPVECFQRVNKLELFDRYLLHEASDANWRTQLDVELDEIYALCLRCLKEEADAVAVATLPDDLQSSLSILIETPELQQHIKGYLLGGLFEFVIKRGVVTTRLGEGIDRLKGVLDRREETTTSVAAFKDVVAWGQTIKSLLDEQQPFVEIALVK